MNAGEAALLSWIALIFSTMGLIISPRLSLSQIGFGLSTIGFASSLYALYAG
ncbi:MAG: hypothetical protein ACE5Z5_08045 [Candidatus Bathyarchaeia archaeon]